MGILDVALGSVLGGMGGGGAGRRGGRSPIVNALLVALAAKALQHYMSNRSRQAPGAAPGGAAGGGLGGMLGGALGGAGGSLGGLGGLGGVLGSLGGAGGLGGLLEQFNRRGLTNQAQSWVSTGPNQPLAAADVAAALDDDDVERLVQETGLPREQVLQEVASALPEAIDQLTPNGRLPSDGELADLVADYERQAASH